MMPLHQLNPFPRGSETILLVDSEPETRKLALFMLQRQGYTVLEARNGVEALSLFEKRDSEVALLLTEVKGRAHQLAAKLQQLHPALRVLYMSDSENWAVVRSIVEQGLPTANLSPPSGPICNRSHRPTAVRGSAAGSTHTTLREPLLKGILHGRYLEPRTRLATEWMGNETLGGLTAQIERSRLVMPALIRLLSQ